MVKWLTASLALFISSAGASITTVDFNALSPGDIVTDQFPGVSISLLGSPPIPGPRVYALKDNSGNPVEIFGASGNAITPGDNVGGINAPFYDMQLSFGHSIDYFSIMVLDAEEAVSAIGYLGGSQVQSVAQGQSLGFHSGSVFNGPVYLIELGAVGGSRRFDRVVIDLTESDGPELYDNVRFSTAAVPEPSVAILIALGAFALLLGRVGKKPQ